jgi:hypothetical protein
MENIRYEERIAIKNDYSLDCASQANTDKSNFFDEFVSRSKNLPSLRKQIIKQKQRKKIN